MDDKRGERKYAHISHAVELEAGPRTAGWEDIHFVHQALLQHDYSQMDTGVEVFNHKLSLPLVINALTGGAPGLEEINGSLARVAKEFNIALAVGSQTAGMANRDVRHTYEIVRKTNPQGLILANVSALVEPAKAREAVEMIEADVLQLHLNGLQELLMVEGDRDFSPLAENIAAIKALVSIPVMVKEVGFGFSRETALRLHQMGVVQALDISGSGGTNFAAIELARRAEPQLDFFKYWGLSSAVSLLEVLDLKLPLTIMASGGIRTSPDMIKALGLGANLVGVAGPFLKILIREGEEALRIRLREIQEEFRIIMMLTGVRNIRELAGIPLVIMGYTREWCEQRGIDIKKYARFRLIQDQQER